ncbi:MAG: hypothetical protein AAF217_14710, partial [Pseudomonadota bacterium]
RFHNEYEKIRLRYKISSNIDEIQLVDSIGTIENIYLSGKDGKYLKKVMISYSGKTSINRKELSKNEIDLILEKRMEISGANFPTNFSIVATVK